MNLHVFVSKTRKQIYEELSRGIAPSLGEFDAERVRLALLKGNPQIGTTRFEPHWILFEFVFPDPLGAAVVLTVKLPTPERVVFMPVPAWAVENIWQGDVDGSFRFESEARELLGEFEAGLTEDKNAEWFEARIPKRRE